MQVNHTIQNEIERIIHKISFRTHDRIKLFLDLPPALQAAVLIRLPKPAQKDVVSHLSDDQVLIALEYLDPDKATDIIQLLTRLRQKILIPKLKEELKSSVELLSQFDPQTAAGLMNVDYIQVEETSTIAGVAKQFREHEQRTGRLPAIIVMKEGKILGNLPGHELGFARPSEQIKKYVQTISSIKYNADYKEVIRTFKAHPHNKVAVLGERENIIGIIYTDDVLRALEEQESASLYDFAGVNTEESVADSIKSKVHNRYSWLIINLGTAFLAAFTVGLFSETISKYVLLAVYMPIVAGMGGNAATQTLAVLVRGIALKQITLQNAFTTLKNEVGAGLINGLINGVIVALVVLIVNKDAKIALILSLAMVVNLLVAAFFGTLIPLIMKRLGKDPATSATIFITTATDVLGFLAFLGLASLILQ